MTEPASLKGDDTRRKEQGDGGQLLAATQEVGGGREGNSYWIFNIVCLWAFYQDHKSTLC